MKNKFEFNDIVKIVSSDCKHKNINGCIGTIKGMAQNELTHEWSYGVSIYKQGGLVWRIRENQIYSVAKKADPREFETGESIKVSVDPKTGEGKIIDDD